MIKLVGVKCLNGNFAYYLANNLDLSINQKVVIENQRGIQVGVVVTDIKNYEDKDVSEDYFEVLRVADDEDINRYNSNVKEAEEALIKVKKMAKNLNLDMRFIDCYYTLDKSQLIYSFIADGRVDFRELAKKLAQVYKTRIELRQIGVRDKAKEVGGIGPCGRFLCCNTFLTDFDSVSINMAKNQYIALNPTKINGVCGRLLCCLKYEDEQYSEMKKGVPNIGQVVEVSGVSGKVSSINLLNRTMVLETKNKTFVTVDMGE